MAGTLASARPAAAQHANLNFHGGPIRNLTIDVVFWGVSPANYPDIREYVVHLTPWINGDGVPAGFDPALRYYGIWGARPGAWIVDTNPIPPPGPSDCLTTCPDYVHEIALAKNGAFGNEWDFAGPELSGNGAIQQRHPRDQTVTVSDD